MAVITPSCLWFLDLRYFKFTSMMPLRKEISYTLMRLLLFADDIILMFGTISNHLDMYRFQTDLINISLWAFNSKMKFNVSVELSCLELKTHHYIFLMMT